MNREVLYRKLQEKEYGAVAAYVSEWRRRKQYFTAPSVSKTIQVTLTHADAIIGKLGQAMSEIGEAYEELKQGRLEAFATELADVAIYMFDLAGTQAIPLQFKKEPLRARAVRPTSKRVRDALLDILVELSLAVNAAASGSQTMFWRRVNGALQAVYHAASLLRIDLDEAIAAKMEVLERRRPMHGRVRT